MQRSYFLTLYQTSDAVFTATRDDRRNPSPANAAPAADDNGDFQGTMCVSHNDTYCGAIRKELGCIVAYVVVDDVNM